MKKQIEKILIKYKESRETATQQILSLFEKFLIKEIKTVFKIMIDDCHEYNWMGEESITKTLKDFQKYIIQDIKNKLRRKE
jgi:hypothetical protein